MAEEHRFQAQEGHILCANNCGFFGSPATSNFCSKCFRDLRMNEEQGALAKSALDGNTSVKSPTASPSINPSPSPSVSSSCAVSAIKLPESASAVVDQAALPSIAVASQPNRCLTCRKRIGLTGFKCRCGSVFCGPHRYPEHHGCTFDYKTMGKEEIARANPVVKAAKLEKI